MNGYTQTAPNNRKRFVITGSLLFLIIGLVIWAYSHSFIQITIPESANEKLTYKIINQKDGHERIIEGSSGSIKKLVPKGNYEVLVLGQEKSSYVVTKTSPFMSTTVVEATLQPEKHRTFIGNNPDPCTHLGSTMLFSYPCDDNYSELKAHLPATQATPTYTETPSNALADLPIGGVVKSEGKDFILLRGIAEAEPELKVNKLVELKPGFSSGQIFKLPELKPGKEYAAKPYRSGFVLYDLSFEHIVYYETISSPPKTIDVPKPKEADITPFLLDTNQDRILIAYSDRSESSDIHESGGKGKTIIQVYESGSTKTLSFENLYDTVRLCGKTQVCLQSKKQVVVYDGNSQGTREIFRVNGVEAFDVDQDTLLVVRGEGVLAIDVSKQTGALHYSLGNYKLCGSNLASSGKYVLCLINSKNNKVSVLINSSQPNSDSIDKKILRLLEPSYVSDVSIYGQYIFISPKLGDPIYNPAINGYTADPAVRQKVATEIEALVGKVGIDRGAYTVINTQP